MNMYVPNQHFSVPVVTLNKLRHLKISGFFCDEKQVIFLFISTARKSKIDYFSTLICYHFKSLI